MAKTIEMTPKSTKWVFIINGIVNSAVGGRIFYTTDFSANWESILGIILVIAGPLSIIYGLILFNQKSKMSTKNQGDQKGVLFGG